jgi:hypothetical protein
MFDVLRSKAYNPFGTVGAASNIDDLKETPSDIHGQKFLYVGGDYNGGAGYAAFDALGGNLLFGLDNSDASLAALVLGYANSAFGVLLDYSISKAWTSNSTAKSSNRTTYPGDNLGLYFSLPLGSFATLYTNASWLTYQRSWSTDFDGTTGDLDYSAIDLNVGLTGGASLKWDGFVNLHRRGGTYTNNNGDVYADANDIPITIGSANFNIGSTILQNQTSRVIVGLNNALGVMLRDKVGNTKSDNFILLHLQPNILGEVALFEYLIGFAGASHRLAFEFGDGDGNTKTHRTVITHSGLGQGSGVTEVFSGIRLQRTNWALEAMVNNTGSLALYNLSGFIYF